MDIAYLLFLQKARLACGSIFDQAFLFLTDLATPVVTFLLFAWVYWCIDKRTGVAMGWNVGLGCTLNTTLKNLFRIDRPWVRDARVTPVEAAIPGAGGYSFPSGHTTRVTATWGVLGTYMSSAKLRGRVVRDQDRQLLERLLGIAGWLVVLAVAFSRNYLGVHTPQDVAVALLLGIGLMYVIHRVLMWADAKERKSDLWIAIGGMVLCFLPMLRFGCMANCGAGMGIFAGWYVERRWIGFTTNGSNSRRALRFVAGAIPLLFLLEVLQPVLTLFMAGKYAGFFTYGIIGFYIMAIYPFLFQFAERKVEEGKFTWSKFTGRAIAGFLIFALVVAGIGYGKNHSLRVAAEQEAFAQQAAATAIVESGTIGQTTYDKQADGTLITADNMGYQVIDRGDSYYYGDGLINTVDDYRAHMDVIAHRGYPAVAPENTIPSFYQAMHLGVDWLETDVQMTKDGVLVLFHDNDLKRITGQEGTIADYTYDELMQMDFGAWFAEGYAGTKIPTLQELCDLIREDDVKVYLELKDIGEVDGFVEAVYRTIEENGLHDRVVYASFNYGYLQQFKALDASVPILCNTMVGNASILTDTPAEYYGIYVQNVTQSLVDSIHSAGAKVFVWTPDTSQEMANLYRMGVDGVCTNQSGVAMVASHPEYAFLADHRIWSHAMPGLYETNLPEQCSDMIWQGFTKTANNMIAAAYSKSGQYNSVFYVMDLNGNLLNVVDAGYNAHMGGLAYDPDHDILWSTGVDGWVYALSMQSILDGTYHGEILAQFDADLYNANGGHVASFCAIDRGFLYVGSYSNGGNGTLKKYDISDINNPQMLSAVTIPDRIQGMTIRDNPDGSRTMILTQGYEMYDGRLLTFAYGDDVTEYLTPEQSYHLPEGAEQVLWTPRGLYIAFESAALPYRPTARNAGDQLWLIQLPQ